MSILKKKNSKMQKMVAKKKEVMKKPKKAYGPPKNLWFDVVVDMVKYLRTDGDGLYESDLVDFLEKRQLKMDDIENKIEMEKEAKNLKRFLAMQKVKDAFNSLSDEEQNLITEEYSLEDFGERVINDH